MQAPRRPAPAGRTASTTERLAAWAARSGPLEEAQARATRRAVLDWLASAVAGAATTPARAARAALADDGGAAQATVLAPAMRPPAATARGAAQERTDAGRPGLAAGSAYRVPAARAAFLNALASHVLELDDLHGPSTLHPGSAVVAAALAVAERRRASGAALLHAVAVGYEIACRIGVAVNPEHYRFWHPTGTVNTFGAAAAAAALQDLGPDAMVDALGSAGTTAAGLWQFLPDGAMSKHLHPANAASAGIVAADLAREGFSGARRILEGAQGFFAATVGEDRSALAVAGLGAGALAVERTSFKLHPCCGHTHTGLDALRDLAHDLAGDAVESVDVHTYAAALQVVAEPDPSTPYEAKFSYPYLVARALVAGGLDDAAFEPAGLTDPAVRRLMARVRLHHDPALDAAYPAAYPARVEVHTASGRTLVAERNHARGTPGDPVGDEEIAAKVVRMVGREAGAHLLRFVDELGAAPVDPSPLVEAVHAFAGRAQAPPVAGAPPGGGSATAAEVRAREPAEPGAARDHHPRSATRTRTPRRAREGERTHEEDGEP